MPSTVFDVAVNKTDTNTTLKGSFLVGGGGEAVRG